MNITLRQIELNSPGWLNHHKNVAHRGQEQLDIHARRADRRAVPLVGQHPGVGDVAIERRREHQHHRAQLVAFAAEMFARQAVAELVQHLDRGHRDAEVEPVLRAEELMKRRQLALEFVEVDGHERQPQHRANSSTHMHRRPAEEPARVLVEPVEEPLGIDAAEAQGEDVGELAHQLAPLFFVAAFDELLALAGRLR